MSDDRREFPLVVVMSVVSGRIFNRVEPVQQLLHWMTGYPIAVHQLDRVMRECVKDLRAQYGWLAKATPDQKAIEDPVRREAWLQDLWRERGRTLRVAKLAPGTYTHIDPIVEHYGGVAGTDARLR